MMRRLLDWFDRWFVRRYQIRPVGQGGFIFRLGLVRHRGPQIVLQDGTVVNPGDLVGELHMDNQRAAALHDEGKGGLRFRREVFRLLPVLGADLAARPEYRMVNAVCGASLFWFEARRAGFEPRPLPRFTRWWLGWWERYLLAQYHPEGKRRLESGTRTELRQVWMSRKTLLGYAARAAAKRGDVSPAVPQLEPADGAPNSGGENLPPHET
ncbi:MAG TPA: hypothetical protein VEP50_13310 [bacterium]|nr:hypothetical protein [bacterium]